MPLSLTDLPCIVNRRAQALKFDLDAFAFKGEQAFSPKRRCKSDIRRLTRLVATIAHLRASQFFHTFYDLYRLACSPCPSRTHTLHTYLPLFIFVAIMGEFVADLDYSYYSTGDPNHVPPSPPEKQHLSLPSRPVVSLPDRAQADLEKNDALVSVTEPAPSFGFPVPPPRDGETLIKPSSNGRNATAKRIRPIQKSSANRAKLPSRPNQSVRAGLVSPPPMTFASITAAPGLRYRSFEVSCTSNSVNVLC